MDRSTLTNEGDSPMHRPARRCLTIAVAILVATSTASAQIRCDGLGDVVDSDDFSLRATSAECSGCHSADSNAFESPEPAAS